MQLMSKTFGGLICVVVLSSTALADGTATASANVDQITGNVSAIHQNGSSNTASVEQQAILGGHANVSSIQQTGDHDSASVTQSGSNDKVNIVQNGEHDTAIVLQNGSSLTAQVTQWGNNGTVGITQFGGSSTAAGKQH